MTKKGLVLRLVIIALFIGVTVIASFISWMHYGEPLLGAFSWIIAWALIGLGSLLFYRRRPPKHYGKITLFTATILSIFMFFTLAIELTAYNLGDPICSCTKI